MSGSTSDPATHSRLAPASSIVFAIAGCVAGALVFNYLLFRATGLPFLWTGAISAVGIAVAIAAPLLLFAARNRRELAGLRLKLNRVSSADHLTDCLEGSVFTALVDAFRSGTQGKPGSRNGALLVIDVDHFKQVNARFGRSWGDEALRVVSHVIRASLRSGDLVGRLGGKEFGVFLPGARMEHATEIAERVRNVIADTLFEPGGRRCLLTVSVGGLVFEDQLIFDELLQAAEQELVAAKKRGGNSTVVSVLAGLTATRPEANGTSLEV